MPIPKPEISNFQQISGPILDFDDGDLGDNIYMRYAWFSKMMEIPKSNKKHPLSYLTMYTYKPPQKIDM